MAWQGAGSIGSTSDWVLHDAAESLTSILFRPAEARVFSGRKGPASPPLPSVFGGETGGGGGRREGGLREEVGELGAGAQVIICTSLRS